MVRLAVGCKQSWALLAPQRQNRPSVADFVASNRLHFVPLVARGLAQAQRHELFLAVVHDQQCDRFGMVANDVFHLLDGPCRLPIYA